MKTVLITLLISLIGALSCEDIDIALYESFYGKWKLYDVSGGFTGRGHDINFDYLELEKENNYRFIKNDRILEFVKVIIANDNEKEPLINFIPDKNSEVFMGDSEKYAVLEGSDTLNLNSPCCDRFNYHFVKE
ncbi:MAG: hypothetical protein C0597_09185 [Marinilabiliales bacterium]|nr:MAG: hypothetical protein C0597_09185 [Marinilabiliales bacterium]